ncbi:MAG: HD domain-containing protein [Mesorhizobium sp.]|uniref:HD domain-containing protein n=1 Tax=Mesorhizobium sp. TaxID=1871066 RepID=UPI000FE7A3D7|nr:HD domain-containing protein [Mesorhizobium sp.]RWM88951.1 MAG: HD domain-containing protein [Mesorhizobium sp.]
MSDSKTQRLRDPVHGLIVFREDVPIDQLAWRLIDTPEFQRLRRIKQLGVSEFTFPGATHTRFAHSIGVFHNARSLVQIIEREMKRQGKDYDRGRADVAVIAALLHDLGHGPFSHTFEGVQKSRGVKKRHEKWTAEIISNLNGCLRPLLENFVNDRDFCAEVSGLLEAEDPEDIYHAVVSSSFDADRLDYLRRDRLMTGTGAGAIDFDWLMDNVRVADVAIGAPDMFEDDLVTSVATFCLDPKALPAAEQFLLARYTLHQQVYFHKTTRCVEAMIAKLLRAVAYAATLPDEMEGRTGLDRHHALLSFFGYEGETIENYLALDDTLIFGSLGRMSKAGDPAIAELAKRLQDRDLYKTLDIQFVGHDPGAQRHAARRIDKNFEQEIEKEFVIRDDSAAVSIYTQIGGDDDKTHKKLHILDGGKPVEISSLSGVVRALEAKSQFIRYYFENDSDRDLAKKGKGPANAGA